MSPRLNIGDCLSYSRYSARKMLINKTLLSHREKLTLFIDLTTSELKLAFNPIGNQI